MIRKVFVVVAICLVAVGLAHPARGQVPISVWGYVYMPDGSPASGASVTVKAGGKSVSTTTDGSGKYKVDLTVESTPVKVTVTAEKGAYRGSATKNVEGVARIDVRLKAPPPPPRPPKPRVEIKIWCNATEVAVNTTISVRGSVSADIDHVSLVLKLPGGEEKRSTVQVKGKKFLYVFKPLVTGLWRIYTVYEGDETYDKSRSNTLEIWVKHYSQVEIVHVNASDGVLEVTGRLEPGVNGMPILVQVSIDGGRTWLNVTETRTGEGGVFSVALNITVYGKIYVRSLFPGNSYYTLSYDQRLISTSIGEEKQRPENPVSEEELEKLKLENQRLNESLREALEEKERLNSELEGLRSKLGEAERRLGETQSQVDKLKSQLEILARQLEMQEESFRTKTLVYPLVALVLGFAAGFILARLSLAAARRKAG